MRPEEIHLDFEESLSQGFSGVFPSTTVMKDFFHFVQANVKKAQKLNMKPLLRDLARDLNTLWYQPTKLDFDAYLNQFLDKWDKQSMYYTSYFRSNWLNRFSPREWASCARPDNSRSGINFTYFFCNFVFNYIILQYWHDLTGSAVAEGFNARLDNLLPKKPLVLDKMVDFLAEEDKYWNRTCDTNHLWEARKKETARAQARHVNKRRTLKHYRERSASSEPTVDFDFTMEDDVQDYMTGDSNSVAGTSKEDSDIIDLVSPPLVCNKASATTTLHGCPQNTHAEPHSGSQNTQAARTNKPLASQRKEICRECNARVIINKACNTHLCVDCCSNNPEPCAPHNARKKHAAVKPYLETSLANSELHPPTKTNQFKEISEKCQSAIDNHHPLYIAYLNKSYQQAQVRKIDPRKVYDDKVLAHCHFRNDFRTFYFSKIAQIEDHAWTNTSSSLPQTPGLFVLLNCLCSWITFICRKNGSKRTPKTDEMV
jgi:hypothetical protein